MSHAATHSAPRDRHLTPDQVAALDRSRSRGHLLLVVALQTGIIATLILIAFVGWDLTSSPGWIHPMAYWCAALYLVCAVCTVTGIRLRRGHPEFN
jgi:hypothetical protein